MYGHTYSKSLESKGNLQADVVTIQYIINIIADVGTHDPFAS